MDQQIQSLVLTLPELCNRRLSETSSTDWMKTSSLQEERMASKEADIMGVAHNEEETPKRRGRKSKKAKIGQEIAVREEDKEACTVCHQAKDKFYVTPNRGTGHPGLVYCVDCVQDMLGVFSLELVMHLRNQSHTTKPSAQFLDEAARRMDEYVRKITATTSVRGPA